MHQDLTATRIGDVELIAAPDRGDAVATTEGEFRGNRRIRPVGAAPTASTRPFSRVTQVISIDRAVRNLRIWYAR